MLGNRVKLLPRNWVLAHARPIEAGLSHAEGPYLATYPRGAGFPANQHSADHAIDTCKSTRAAVARTILCVPCPALGLVSTVTSPASRNASTSRLTALRSRFNRVPRLPLPSCDTRVGVSRLPGLEAFVESTHVHGRGKGLRVS